MTHSRACVDEESGKSDLERLKKPADRVGGCATHPVDHHATDMDTDMAHWKKSFPSRYLQVSDLDDGPIVATIKNVGAENVGAGEDAELKLVVKFKESDVKSLVCNLTRADAIATLAGSEDTDNWPGTRIAIRKGTTSYKGKRVECISVEAPPKASRGKGASGDSVAF